MTPRPRLASLERTDTAQDVIDLARSTGFSRFPVIDDGIDDVVGLVHVKQAVAVPREKRDDVPVTALQSEALRVPETMKLDMLLGELRGRGYQMAVVVDEYGGTAGVATLEDLVEELVGEVSDEHDRSRPDVVRSRDWFTFPGILRPDELLERTDVNVPEDGPYETVAGWMMSELGRLPIVGDAVTVNGGVFRVERMDGRRIDRVRYTPRSGEAAREGRAMSDWWGIGWLVILLFINAFFVAAEFSIISARRSQIEPRADKGSRPRENGAVGDGTRHTHARHDPVGHHRLLAADPERFRAGDPRPRVAAAQPAALDGDRRRDGLVPRRAARGVVPPRDFRRDGAEEPLVLRPGARGADPRTAAGGDSPRFSSDHRGAERDLERRSCGSSASNPRPRPTTSYTVDEVANIVAQSTREGLLTDRPAP